MTTIRTKIRQLLNDNSTNVKDIFTYGSSTIFTLTDSNVITITSVLRNDVELSSSEYSFDSTNSKLTINISLTSGDTIEINYTCYLNYSDTELTNYIQSALVHLSINGYEDFEYDSTDDAIYPTPTNKEENLIALVTSIIIDPNNNTIRLPDITITVPIQLPTNKLISKTIGLFKRSESVSGVFEILA